MARCISNELFMCYRFVIHIPTSGKLVSVSSIRSLEDNRLCIERAISKGVESLFSELYAHQHIDVYIVGRDSYRKIAVKYKDIRWFPVSLDAAMSSVAIDKVFLTDVYYAEHTDVNFDDPLLPEEVKKIQENFNSTLKS